MASSPPRLSPRAQSPIRLSPQRSPLHERTGSQTNEITSPTIRVVEDSDARVYSKTPFPRLPSQMLPPRNAPPGYVFEDKELHVSDRSPPTNPVSSSDSVETLVPKPLQIRKSNRNSSSTNVSEAETNLNGGSLYSPSSSRFSLGTSPPSSPTPDGFEDSAIGGLEILKEEVPLEKVENRPTIRTIIPSSSSAADTLVNDSLAFTPIKSLRLSETSSVTLTHQKKDERRDSSITSIPPIDELLRDTPSPNYRVINQASSTEQTPARRPIPRASSESIPYSIISYPSSERLRFASSPAGTPNTNNIVTLEDGSKIQFPIVRPPSVSGLWAESRPLPKNPARMPAQQAWSSRLSTIPSESTQTSKSIDGSSRATTEASTQTAQPQRRQTIASIASSDGQATSNYSEPSLSSSIPVPQPLFSSRPDDSKDSDEQHDRVPELRSPLSTTSLRAQRSGYFTKYTDSRPTSSRPDSAHSDFSTFVANTIPTWARFYYRRGERTSIYSIAKTESSVALGSSVALESSAATVSSSLSRAPTGQSERTISPIEVAFPLSIYRPRNRPRQQYVPQPEPMVDSAAQTPTQPEQQEELEEELYVVGGPQQHTQEQQEDQLEEHYAVARPRPHLPESYTARLRADRRSTGTRISLWRAPSLDETFGTLVWNRANRQILLFCLGFLLPFSWWIASFLPLPENPHLSKEPTPSQLDIERMMALHIGPIDEKRYQKAVWWRNLNRIMSVVGVLLIAAIIALGVVASRMA